MDETQQFYKIELEPILNHYHFLWAKQKTLINSILGRLYVIFDKGDHSKIESWEFLILIKYIEPEEYNPVEMKKLFYSHADSSLEIREIPAMSLGRFSKLCLMKDLLGKDAERSFHKVMKKMDELSNLEEFTQKYRAIYRVKNKELMSFKLFFREIF